MVPLRSQGRYLGTLRPKTPVARKPCTPSGCAATSARGKEPPKRGQTPPCSLLESDRRSHANLRGRDGWFHRAPVAKAGIVNGVGDRRRYSRSYKSAATTPERIGPTPLLLWTTEAGNTGGRRSRAAGSRGRVSRARRRRRTPRRSAELCESCDRRCRRKGEKPLRAASLWMLAPEPDVDPARVPEAIGAPLRRHSRRDGNGLDGVGDQPSPSR